MHVQKFETDISDLGSAIGGMNIEDGGDGEKQQVQLRLRMLQTTQPSEEIWKKKKKKEAGHGQESKPRDEYKDVVVDTNDQVGNSSVESGQPVDFVVTCTVPQIGLFCLERFRQG